LDQNNLKIKKNKPKITEKFNAYFRKFEAFYSETLEYVLSRKKSIIIFLIFVLCANFLLFTISKKELLPKEDRGVFFVIIKAAEGSGFNFTSKKVEQIEEKFLPKVGKGEIRRLLLRVPGFGSSGKQVNSGFIIVLLEDWSKRKDLAKQL